MSRHVSRRDFLKTSTMAAAAGSLAVWSELPAQESNSPSERLNVAVIGVAGRGGANVNGVATQNIVALCDVDDNNLNGVGKRFPAAKKYNDFRKLLDEEANAIEAVTVSTADHTHAPAGLWAMQLGKHCYCEKPLTHNVWEAREMAKTAAKHKLATQMGTQIHAGDNYRRVVEIIQSGAIGDVREAIVWVGKGWGGGERPTDSDPVPANLHWDLWLGPAPERPFKSGRYHPQQWRRWWDFGGGTLGDMACHYCDLPFWALDLRHPSTIEADGPPVHQETCPTGLHVKWQFPARGEKPPVTLHWYDGDMIPKEVAGHAVPGSGVMFVGEKGQMFANYGSYKLYPESEFKDFEPPKPTIPNSIGHHAEWIKACKEGGATTCNFDYSGALTEAVLLGNVAYRTGEKLEWDAENLKATNCPAADQYLRREYRPGWRFT
ncbi:MAG: Gfo/Idh/MocA family oxidoreductase [Pirellulaceae bacterium]